MSTRLPVSSNPASSLIFLSRQFSPDYFGWNARPPVTFSPAVHFSARLGGARSSRSGRMFRQRAQIFIQASSNDRNRLIHVGRAEQIARQCFVHVLADCRDLRL